MSAKLACECVQQLVDNKLRTKPIPLPENFMNEEKVEIWNKLKLKLSECYSHDESVNDNIDTLWQEWSRLLFDKESKEENNVAQINTPRSRSPRHI